MNTKPKKSSALKLLEKLSGGPLTLGEMIRSIREGEGIAQNDFAAKLRISKSHLCDIEKGRKSVSVVRAVGFAKLLGYSKAQFAELALQSQLDEAGLRYRISIEAA